MTAKEFPLSYSSAEDWNNPSMEKHFENQKLVEQMITGNWGQTLSLYSTAHLIVLLYHKHKITFMVPLSVAVVVNPGHEEDLHKMCAALTPK